jgi:hypothetical protein
MSEKSGELFPCSTTSEARCHCGQLVAILKKNGVELKCKRCKRLILIPFTSLSSHDGSELSFQRVPEDAMPCILTPDHQ